MTVTQDSSLGSQTLAANSIAQKVGSFSFTASQSEGVTISNLTIGVNSGVTVTGANYLANLKVMVNGTQFGSTQPTVAYNAALSSNTYSFSGTPFTVPAGSTVVVGVYADVLSSATGSLGNPVYVSGLSGTGASSYTAVSLANGPIQGQAFTVSLSGASLNVTINTSNQPANGQLSMGATGNTLASLNFNETTNVENVKLTSLDLIDVAPSATTTIPSFSNLTLWNGTEEVGSVQSYTATTTAGASSTPAFLYVFTNLLNNGTNGAYVPRNGILNLVLKGDVNSYTSGNATDNSNHTFQIATTSYTGATATSSIVVAQGATSGKSVQITLPALTATSSGPLYTGPTTQNVLRTTLAFSASPLGASSGRAKSASDAIASMVFTPGNGGSAALNKVMVTFTGTAVSTTISFPSSTTYLLVGTPSSFTSKFSASSSTTSTANTVVEEWDLGDTTAGLNLSGPTTLTLVGDTTLTNAGGSNNSVSLYANIQTTSAIQYTDGVSGTTVSSLGLPSSVLTPIQLNGVQFQTNS